MFTSDMIFQKAVGLVGVLFGRSTSLSGILWQYFLQCNLKLFLLLGLGATLGETQVLF